MLLEGVVRNGKIEPDPPKELPEGARVIVTPKAENAHSESSPTLLSLMKLVGTCDDLPVDFAEQHDHYIHGTPKR
jgi:hypothetical protein